MSACCDYAPLETDTGAVVCVYTLGTLEAAKNGKRLGWYGSGVGACQLKRGFSYLLAKRDSLVSREVLIEVAGTDNIVSGLGIMLHHWKIDSALQRRDRKVMLVTDRSWISDADHLEHLLLEAQQCERDGDRLGQLEALRQVERLCKGTYLPEYDAPPEYSIGYAVAFWHQRQKDALCATAEACSSSPDPIDRATAISAAQRAVDFDPDNPEAYLFAAKVARRCNNEALARSYEREAQRLRSSSPW